MNEKHLLYILIVLTVITNSVASPTNPIISNSYDVKDTIAYWTPERMSNAKPLIGLNKTSDGEENGFSVNASNFTPEDAGFEIGNNIGKLFFHNPYYNSNGACTASVINTDNGNIGLTAAHCLIGGNNNWYTRLAFCPGFNNNQCTFGLIPIRGSSVVLVGGTYYYDYGMVKFDGIFKLQDRTGYLNWDANPGNGEIAVTVIGYPVNGDMSCARDGKSPCMWQGNSIRDGSFRTIPVNSGSGSSGGPWIKQYDPKTKLGVIVASTSTSGVGRSSSAVYAWDVFTQLIKEASSK